MDKRQRWDRAAEHGKDFWRAVDSALGSDARPRDYITDRVEGDGLDKAERHCVREQLVCEAWHGDEEPGEPGGVWSGPGFAEEPDKWSRFISEKYQEALCESR